MGVYEAVKDAAALAQEVGKMDLYRELVDAMKKEVEQERALQTLEARVTELEEALAFSGKLRREGDYLLNEADSDDGRPYCMHCWEDARKALHLYENNETSWRCRRCDGVTRKAGQPRYGPPIRRNTSTV